LTRKEAYDTIKTANETNHESETTFELCGFLTPNAG